LICFYVSWAVIRAHVKEVNINFLS